MICALYEELAGLLFIPVQLIPEISTVVSNVQRITADEKLYIYPTDWGFNASETKVGKESNRCKLVNTR